VLELMKSLGSDATYASSPARSLKLGMADALTPNRTNAASIGHVCACVVCAAA